MQQKVYLLAGDYENISDPGELPALEILFKCLKCEGCGRIPLKLQECTECGSVICDPCKNKIKSIENPIEKRRCPDPECTSGENFDV